MKKIQILFLLVLTSCSNDAFLKSQFPGLKFDSALRDQKISIDKNLEAKNIGGKKIKFEGALKNHLLIAEVMTEIEPDQSVILMKNKKLLITGLYKFQTEENCFFGLQTDSQPVDNKIQTSLQFNLKATERLVLGICNEDQNVFWNQTLLLYCKKDKTFYDMSYYYPKSGKLNNSPIARCAR